ncbi:bifunctional diguanylate cyclase/phosphodiesterase [Photobacterium indicum]|uniref:cyclic-guanylate-specific phosphodiesterase n=1 Tax=Photobacterium indicum TaxID=81447 RepID=A0A2T3L5N4_9GAMM|nr:EAL domain-containing protein [Photobacterium indicum]PSV45212.1 diguanylate phosphodiesterase [Photobacterium indicum]
MKQMYLPNRRVICGALFLLISSIGIYWTHISHTLNAQEQHLLLSDIVNAQAKAFERRLSQSLSATHILALEVQQQNGRIDDFDHFSEEVLRTIGGISNLQLAPDGIIQKIYPLLGHEKAIGHNILKDDKRRKEALSAINEQKLTLAGPFKLIQGGVAVIGRNPVFFRDGNKQIFWGFTAALIYLDDLLASTELDLLQSKGYRYQLTRRSPDTGETEVIAASRESIVSPHRTSTINIPNATWKITISRPMEGSTWQAALGYLTSITIALFGSWAMWFVLRQPEKLQKIVKQKTHELEKFALYDHLTGLANRRLLNEHLEQVIQQTEYCGNSAALLYFDLDDFKRINDSQGHEVGDGVLQQISHRLNSVVNKSDIVARIGGDEFTVLLSASGSAFDTGRIAERLINVISEPIFLNNKELSVSASVGITMIPSDGNDVSTLLRNADMAMYSAKKSGKRNYLFFNKTLQKKALYKMSIEEGLDTAISKKQFVLHYQPVFSFDSNKLCCYEALIRWNHPREGLLHPESFIGIAEESGKIKDIGYWVIQDVCDVIKMQQLHIGDSYRIAVNLSPKQFNDPDLLENIRRIILDVGIDARSLEIEITESTLMENIESAIHTLHQFKELGITVAIDDFGTGYSSLAMLKRLPVDKLKIDRSFVKDLSSNNSDQKIVQALISMAHTLQISVIAEGIETQEQYNLLQQYGCDFGQGYFFSKPVPITELTVAMSPVV